LYYFVLPLYLNLKVLSVKMILPFENFKLTLFAIIT
jgi:hypothetical protein